MDLNIYRIFHPAAAQYTCAAHVTFSKIDYILGDETSLNKCMKVESTISIRTQ
jgi:hypothetical protein